MRPIKRYYNLALVGAGRQGMAILEALVPPRRKDQALFVIGVADRDPEAPGLKYAREHGVFVTLDYHDLCQLPDLDIVVNATGDWAVAQELSQSCPGRLIIFNCRRAYHWEDLCDLLTLNLTVAEDFVPFRLGIVGGGKGCREVLELLVKDPRTRGRFQIIGIADPDPEAPGIRFARELGLPTFTSYEKVLAAQPEVILELTGDPEVREELLQKKPPQTQVIDHIKARLFWELLRVQDETLRDQIESEIRLAGQHSHFQKIFDQLPDPVLVLLPDYTIEYANQTFFQRFHKQPAEVIGRPCHEIFREYARPCLAQPDECQFKKVLEAGETVSTVLSYRDKQGEIHYDEITMAPLQLNPGGRRRVIEVIKNISQYKRLEQAFRDLLAQVVKGKKFLETILNGIEDQMMVIDLDYRIVEVNRALLEMVGMKRQEVVGKHCYEISHHLTGPCQSPDHPCPLQDAVRTGKAASATHTHFDKDGREHYIHVVCHPIFDEQGKVHRVIDLSRDITQEINARTRMLHDDKMASLGKLSASVVHEINNPLTGILNFIKLIQRLLGDGPPSEADLQKIRHYLEVVYNETSRISKTVSNLLTFSRKTKPELKPLNLNQLLDETLSLVEYQLRLQNIVCKRDYADNLALILGDAAQLKQAILNLILNAQDAMPKGGTLTLKTRNSKRREVVLQVTDTGVGIPKESFSHIFEPFYTTKKAGSGVGLGLSVVYGIVRDHKGIIKVDSVVGKGTTFTLRFAAYKPEEQETVAESQVVAASSGR